MVQGSGFNGLPAYGGALSDQGSQVRQKKILNLLTQNRERWRRNLISFLSFNFERGTLNPEP